MTTDVPSSDEVEVSKRTGQAAARSGYRVWVGILVTLGCLVAAAWGIDIPNTLATLGRIDYGYILLFHYLTVLALAPFGIDKSTGFACGIVLHLVVLIPTLLLGGISLWQERISFQQLAYSLAHLRAHFQAVKSLS